MKIPSKFWHSITYSLLFLLVIVHPSKYGVGVFCFAIVPKSTNNQYSALSSNISTPQTHAAFSSPRNKKNKSSSALSLVPPNSCGGTSLGATAQSSEYGGASKKDDEVGIWPCYDELDKRIISVALPCIANYAITPLVGAVDLFWVGRMGNALAIAGQSAANQVFSSTFWLASYLPSGRYLSSSIWCDLMYMCMQCIFFQCVQYLIFPAYQYTFVFLQLLQL